MTTYRYDHDESMNDDMNYNNVSMNGVNENIYDNVGITENDVSMNDVNENIYDNVGSAEIDFNKNREMNYYPEEEYPQNRDYNSNFPEDDYSYGYDEPGYDEGGYDEGGYDEGGYDDYYDKVMDLMTIKDEGGYMTTMIKL